MDLTFQIDFSPVKKYTINPALSMMGYIDNLLEKDDPITIGVNNFQSFTKSDKAQFYFCLKAGPMWYMSLGKASQGMICYALLEALKNQFPSTVKPFENYQTPDMERYADILASYLWLSFLESIEQVRNNNDLERLDYMFAEVSASALAHNDLKATLQVSEYRQMLHYYSNNSMRFVLQEIFKLKSSNLADAREEESRLLDAVVTSSAKLPSAREEKWLREVSEERWKELEGLGFFPNRTTSIELHQAADKAIMLVPLFTNKILVHDIFSNWFQALLDLCTKDIKWWGVTDEVFESVDQLIRIWDDVDLRKMHIFHLANFEYLKSECAYEADARQRHARNRVSLLEQLAELDD